jgi:peroxiredoxin
MLKINQKTPSLTLETTSGSTYSLKDSTPDTFTLLVFYRGLHCPKCKEYLEELNKIVTDYKEVGVNDVLCISGDTKEKAKSTKKQWDISNLNIGFELSVDSMNDWGLYISEAIKDTEPAIFNEPGVFLINRNKELFYAGYNSMPFARPSLNDLLSAVKFIKNKDYPARGTYAK